MKFKKNIALSKYTTFQIGGPTDYFIEVKNIDEVLEAVKWAKENKQNILPLGGGSNIVISDQGFRGLVIKLGLDRLEIRGETATAGAGVVVSYLINQTLDRDLVGLEFMAGIPGTVGGAIRGNAGTYGQSMADVLTEVRFLDEKYELRSMKPSEALFQYRHSIFKEKKYLILEADLEFKKGDIDAARKLVDERLKYRQDTQPHQPSAGCIFKNLNLTDVDVTKLQAKGIDTTQFEKFQKIPAGYLIDHLGLKGKTIGGAQISEKHANYIVNTGQATADDVITLISFIKQQIRDEYGVQLQEEVQLII
ncbi:MAG: UDP-N-acetylenolpyruvoylglucosamine reductase [Parcubacteria group bacterium]|nr:MAG: UDP-N-acetylenolpyruvoylglucosamine reductase [Parcubacteria group bacterium]